MIPRFETVPDHWKKPYGPYVQAPEEHGGEWWLINPFTSGEPWLQQTVGRKEEKLPDGFVELFGRRPKAADFMGQRNLRRAFQAALILWRQDLKYFRESGTPPWTDAREIAAAAQVYRGWQMGEPKFYLGRYDWMARFVDSEIPDYDSAAWTVINFPHLVVAQYQIRLVDSGTTPAQQHPFVPPHVWPNEESQQEVA